MVLNFTEFVGNFLAEAKGADTAYSGHANEHFTHHILNRYLEHLKNSVQNGKNDDEAHAAAIDHINSLKYSKKQFSHIPELQNASQHFGDEEMSNIHEDSKKTANAILNHLRNHYKTNIVGSMHVGKGGPKAVEKLTGGKKSEADLLLQTKDAQGKQDTARAYLEHVGASLKYSKGLSSTLKIHSPTINKMAEIIDSHHKQMHGKSSGIHDELNGIAQEGVNAQKAALAKHHDALSNYFSKLNNPKLTYKPHLDANGNVIGGELSQDAVSEIRDSKDPKLQAAYKDMSTENLKMKNKMAEALHRATSSVLDHEPNNVKHNPIKESLLRSMGNLHTDKLPTFLVSTERSKPQASVYDVGNFFTRNLQTNGLSKHNYTGKSTFGVGPMSFALDTRPTTTRNPVTSFPINTTVKTSHIKNSDNKQAPEIQNTNERPRKLSIAVQDNVPETNQPTQPKPAPRKRTSTLGGLKIPS